MACRNSVLKITKKRLPEKIHAKATLPFAEYMKAKTRAAKHQPHKKIPSNVEKLCTCTEGYTGQNCENEYIPCDPSPCANGGRCRSGDKHTYTCECPSGSAKLPHQPKNSRILRTKPSVNLIIQSAVAVGLKCRNTRVYAENSQKLIPTVKSSSKAAAYACRRLSSNSDTFAV
ncbi:hypothetical protein HUJ05_011540 [Dendroctonus ponderosae]|nr:hypothetical protein HUJ05_011540 [Dendroctonus ponderosae]